MKNYYITYKNDNLPEIVIEFLNYSLSVKEASKDTVEGYSIDLSLFLRFMKCYKCGPSIEECIENVDIRAIDYEFISSIKIADIYAFMNYITMVRGNGPHARARKTSAIRQFYKYLNSIHAVENTTYLGLKPPRVKPADHHILSESESIFLLKSIDGIYKERDLAIITLILNCGLKISEIAELDIDDLNDSSIVIKSRRDGYKVEYLKGDALEVIKGYDASRSCIAAECNALFLSERKNRISKRTLQYIVQKYLGKAGLGTAYNSNELRYTSYELLRKYGSIDIYNLGKSKVNNKY